MNCAGFLSTRFEVQGTQVVGRKTKDVGVDLRMTSVNRKMKSVVKRMKSAVLRRTVGEASLPESVKVGEGAVEALWKQVRP